MSVEIGSGPVSGKKRKGKEIPACKTIPRDSFRKLNIYDVALAPPGCFRDKGRGINLDGIEESEIIIGCLR